MPDDLACNGDPTEPDRQFVSALLPELVDRRSEPVRGLPLNRELLLFSVGGICVEQPGSDE
jgi:hypothetical protein